MIDRKLFANMLSMRRLAVAVLLCLGAALTAVAPAHAQQGQLRIAAVVNDEAISFFDLEMRISMAIVSAGMENSLEIRRRLGPQVLRTLINERLMSQEVNRLGIEVTEEQVAKAVETIEQQNGMPPGGMSRLLGQIGVPMSTMLARTRAELGWQMMLQRRILPKIKISEEEIDEEIKLIQANAGRPEYLIAEIFLPVDNPANDASVHADARRLFEQLKMGAAFPALARNFSRSPSASVGGDLGWVQPGQIAREIEEVLADLSPGEVSAPVQALGGYYILFLRNERVSPGLSAPDAEVRLSQLHESIPQGASRAEVDAIRARLNAAAASARNCAELEQAGAQLGSAMSGSLGTVKMSALPDEMRQILEGLDVDQPSAPVVTGGGLAVMMICEKTGGSMHEIRETIRDRLAVQRLEIAARQLLRNLHRNAFLDIRI